MKFNYMKLFKRLQSLAPEWDAIIAVESKPFEDGRDDIVRVGRCIRISINFFRIFILKFDLIINYWWK